MKLRTDSLIKILQIGCLVLIIVFIGLAIYGKNKYNFDFQTIDERNYGIFPYDEFLLLYDKEASFLVDDGKVSKLEDLIDESELILKVKSIDRRFSGYGLINDCEVLEVYKAINGFNSDNILIYDFTENVSQNSITYIEGATPFVSNQEYLVFLKKAPNPNMKDTYICSSINYGKFNLNNFNDLYLSKFDNFSLKMKDTYNYTYIGNDDRIQQVYMMLYQEVLFKYQ